MCILWAFGEKQMVFYKSVLNYIIEVNSQKSVLQSAHTSCGLDVCDFDYSHWKLVILDLLFAV